MRAALRSLLALGALAALSGASISWFAAATAERAERNRAAAQQRIVRELAGDAAARMAGGEMADGMVLCTAELAVAGGSGRGYGGDIRIAVALAPDGAVHGVRVVRHAETPGFADILDAGSAWLAAFATGEVHAVTGATVTSRAVMQAVRDAARRFAARGGCDAP